MGLCINCANAMIDDKHVERCSVSGNCIVTSKGGVSSTCDSAFTDWRKRIAELEAALATATGARERVCEVVDRRDAEIARLRAEFNALQARLDRPYRCPHCNGVGKVEGNSIMLWCELCGGTGAVAFDPSTEMGGA